MKRTTIILSSLALLAATLLVGCSGQKECKSDSTTYPNKTIQTIMERRSIRKFLPEVVDRATLATILECGINAPNGQNKQSWAVRVVDNPETMARIEQMMIEAHPDVDPSFAKSCYRGAPVMVYIARDCSYPLSALDCGMLAENICLSAWSLGVGSICLGSPLPLLKGSEAMELLQLPEGHELVLCIGLGYADEQPEAKPRDKGKIRFVE